MLDAAQLQRRVDDVFELGIDDWIQAADVAPLVLQIVEPSGDAELREIDTRVVRQLLGRDLVCAGAVAQTGLVPWELSAEEALARIEADGYPAEWPELAEVCWLDLTENGVALAQRRGQPVRPTSRHAFVT